MLQEIMLQDTPLEEREEVLRDSCDQIVERSYTRKFDSEALAGRKNELANISIQMQSLEQELAEIRADYKGRIKPLQERHGKLLDEIKAGGEWVRGNVYKFVDSESGMTGFYDDTGHLIESRPMSKEERQRTIQQEERQNAFRVVMPTGTEG